MKDIKSVAKKEREVMCSEYDDELLIFDEDNKKIHTLNKTASYIYNLINLETPFSNILSRVGEYFNIKINDEVYTDVVDIIKSFEINDLVSIVHDGE